MYRIITIVLVFAVISGCSTVKITVAMMQSTANFSLYSDKEGLIYQEGKSSLLATEAEKYLGKAIAIVEKEQYRDFAKPVKVYVVSTLDNFENYCVWRLVLGCVINEKVFLSPRILSEPSGTLPRLLTHELSHLHLDQQLSMLEWASIPVWFREGLAIYVSTKSGGAEIEIKNGNSFYPNTKGSLFFSKSHLSFGLSRTLFYRQAGSFIKFLRLSNEKGFKNLLLSIQEKKNFSESFKKYFGVSINGKWEQFVEEKI